MNELEIDGQDKIKKDINARYRDHINGLLIVRFRLIFAIGITIHLLFNVIDRIAYPDHGVTFLKIRCIDAFLVLILILLTYTKKIKPYMVWLSDMGGTIIVFGMALMVFLADGSSSHYYEGANLVILGAIGIANPFYIGHAIVMSLLWIGINEVAMIANHTPFNLLTFGYANYFMGSTALVVLLMAKFYKDQHYNSFVRQEQLKINEQTLAALYNQADKLSKIDTLTEINNRRSFSDMLQKKMEACEAAKTSFYLVIFDVDFFKQVNDTYGHAFGDLVLVKVVEVVKNNTRANDFIGRFGGDEFIICLDFPNKEGIVNRLTKISNGIKSLTLKSQDKDVPVSVSIGAAKFKPGMNMSEEKLMEMADFELFNVKKTQRGQISVNE